MTALVRLVFQTVLQPVCVTEHLMWSILAMVSKKKLFRGIDTASQCKRQLCKFVKHWQLTNYYEGHNSCKTVNSLSLLSPAVSDRNNWNFLPWIWPDNWRWNFSWNLILEIVRICQKLIEIFIFYFSATEAIRCSSATENLQLDPSVFSLLLFVAISLECADICLVF